MGTTRGSYIDFDGVTLTPTLAIRAHKKRGASQRQNAKFFFVFFPSGTISALVSSDTLFDTLCFFALESCVQSSICHVS